MVDDDIETVGAGGSERRRDRRYAVNLPQWILWKKKAVECRLVDVSSSGALLQSKSDMRTGDEIEMNLPDGTFARGRIVRATATHIALSFEGIIAVAPFITPLPA